MDISPTDRNASARRQSAAGMTMIELLMAMAVVAIVMAFALPSFRSSTQNSAITSATMDLVTALNTARAQAVSLRSDITLAAVNGNWVEGWEIQYPATAVEQNQEFNPPGGVQIVEAGGLNQVVFDMMGLPDNALAISLCDGRPNETGRAVTLSRAGRVTSENLNPCL